MTIPAGLHSRTDVGDKQREDLTDIIYNISPTETPFHQNVGRADATADKHEWTIDSLATAADDNAHVDGDDFVAEGQSGGVGSGTDGVALTAGTRLGNYQQISRKDIVVSRRADVIRKAGRRSELNYQVAKAGRELKRDCEAAALANVAGTQGSETVAPRTAGVPAWIATNDDLGATGASGSLSSGVAQARTDGTLRALTEQDLLDVIANVYLGGGDPDMIMMYPTVKQKFSNFMFEVATASSGPRVATQNQDHKSNPRSGVTVVGAVDVYVSDFGVLDVVPNRFQRTRDVFVLESDMWAISFLDGYHIQTMGKTGDSRKRVLLVDWGVESRNEAASGLVTDVNSASAMTRS